MATLTVVTGLVRTAEVIHKTLHSLAIWIRKWSDALRNHSIRTEALVAAVNLAVGATYDCWMGDAPDVGLGSIVGWMRLAVGVGMIAAPAPVIRLGSGETPSGDMVLMTRTVGVRDLALGMGTVWSCRSRSSTDARRWVALGLCSDLLDFVVGATSARSVGRRGALIAALAPVPFIALDVAALASLK